MTTLFKHKKTGARVKIISELDNGDCFMVEDQDSRTFYAYKHELENDPEGTKKVKTLQIKDKASKEEPRDFPPETRLNINGATAQMIADHIKGIGVKRNRIKAFKWFLEMERSRMSDNNFMNPRS